MASQPSPLPSPPTSPTSPRAATSRIPIKPSRRSLSIGNIPSPDHAERTRGILPSVSRILTDPEALGTETAPPCARRVGGNRRQSSIAYYTPASPAPGNQSKRTLSSVEPVMANENENVSKRPSLVLSSRSTSTRDSSLSSLDTMDTRERGPLTLIEKHAELLHFIAQKERRCLELRDQLAAHEKELAELKRRWGRIVNGGHEPLPNSPLNPGIGGVALDGLKEGVRMIAAGFSDLGGVISDIDPGEDASKRRPPNHASCESPTVRMRRTDSEHLSMSSMSSIQESAHVSERVPNGKAKETMTVATAPLRSRTSSVNSWVHRRASRAYTQEPTTPTNASVSSSPPASSPTPVNLDVGMSLVLSPSPTLVPPLFGALSVTSPTPAPKSTANVHDDDNGEGLIHGAGLASPGAGPMSSWMDSMGKKLSELQKGQTFSKSQRRASSLFAGVSSTISAALLPGPTATTPAPFPSSVLAPTTATRPAASPVSTKFLTTRRSLRQRPSRPEFESDARSCPSYKSMEDWLDDDEEQTIHVGGVLRPDSKVQSRRTTDGRADATASSFDDDWNW